MRSLADQTTEELGGRWSVLTRQKLDHARMNRLLDQLPGTGGERREELLNRICRLVFSHAFAEEAVLWPALRRALPEGEALTTKVEREHQDITEAVAALDATDPDDPERDRLVERTVDLLRKDARDEEDELLPRLQGAVDAGTLRRLGLTWELVRRTAPTRAHPIVARRPPGNTLSAIPLSAIDRTRDVLDHAARRGGRRGGAVAGGASRVLGAAARRVEHLGPLRRGERPETHVDP